MTRVVRRLGYPHVILGIGFAVLFFGTGSRYVFGLVLVPMTEDLGVSRSTLSSALLAFMLVSAPRDAGYWQVDRPAQHQDRHGGGGPP